MIKWFLIACMATANNPCEERAKVQLDTLVGERAYVEAICWEIELALDLNKIKPTKFSCEYVGGTKPKLSFENERGEDQ